MTKPKGLVLSRRAVVGAALLLSVSGFTACAAEPSLTFLRADGPKVVNEKNERVVLGGPNLGSWLVEEMWMMPFEIKAPDGSGYPNIKDRSVLWNIIEKRLGAAQMREVRTALRNAWVTEKDFDRIQAAGLNCVRLPFTYDLLEEPDGWSWIDKCLDWAGKRGIYVILDLHGAPGRQSSSDHTGESDVDRLFKDPKMVDATVEVWTKIATRYKDNPVVAGYDLLNEPMGVSDYATLYLVEDRLYRAIRAVDKKHICIFEDGYKGRDSFPRPKIVGWENVMFSYHHYHFDSKTEADQAEALAGAIGAGRALQESRQTPFYLGEFQLEPHGTPGTLEKGIVEMQEGGIAWSNWTYKAVMPGGGGGMWGWIHSPKPVQVINPYTDSAADMKRKIEQVRSENLVEQKAMTDAFKAGSKVTPLPPPQEIVPTSQNTPSTWQYTFNRPADNWTQVGFAATGWQQGPGGFGAGWDFPPKIRSAWSAPDIWLRREFELPNGAKALQLRVCHDDDAEVYINGVLAANLPGYNHEYAQVPISKAALDTLKPGKNVFAVHCRSTVGGQFIDVGLVGVK